VRNDVVVGVDEITAALVILLVGAGAASVHIIVNRGVGAVGLG